MSTPLLFVKDKLMGKEEKSYKKNGWERVGAVHMALPFTMILTFLSGWLNRWGAVEPAGKSDGRRPACGVDWLDGSNHYRNTARCKFLKVCNGGLALR